MSLSIQENPPKEPWSNTKCITIAIASLIIGVVIFAFAYIGMSKHIGLGNLNQPVLDWIVKNRDPQITNVFKVITTTMSPLILIAAVMVVAIIWAVIKRELWRPFLVVIATGLGVASSTAVKLLTTNHRPPESSMIAPFETDYSFPSSHTIGIVVFLLVFSYLICSRRPEGSRIFLLSLISFIGISIVAASRLYLGYHWTTDVIASLGLGLVILATAIFIDRIVAGRSGN